MAPVFRQLCDALAEGGFWVELDAQRNDRGEVIGTAGFQLRVRRPSDGHVVAAGGWTIGTEAAAVSLVTELLMNVDPEIRVVVGHLQL